MDSKDAKNIIKDLSEKPFLCSENRIETEKYFITKKVQSKPMTNADAIRNMSDEELAKFLELTEACGYNDGSITDLKNGHYMDMLEWLQAEVKEGNSNENT